MKIKIINQGNPKNHLNPSIYRLLKLDTPLYQAQAYWQYWRQARSEYQLHSPAVYALYTQVIKPHKDYYAFAEIEALRSQLRQSEERITVQDLGAGSQAGLGAERSIAQIVKLGNATARQGQLLFKLADYFECHTMLELGTSLGITALYLAKARPHAQLYTLEGCPATADVARRNFTALQASNITLIQGNIDQTLAPTLAALPPQHLDLVYIDANHRYAPTMAYFEQLLSHLHPRSLVVLDDIYWSAEMTQAWEAIKAHPRVCQTIDLFSLGLVFFNTAQAREHFVLKF